MLFRFSVVALSIDFSLMINKTLKQKSENAYIENPINNIPSLPPISLMVENSIALVQRNWKMGKALFP
jgi:hypothetical protein